MAQLLILHVYVAFCASPSYENDDDDGCSSDMGDRMEEEEEKERGREVKNGPEEEQTEA